MAELRERLLHPRAGWSSLPLLAIMALALAWSVQGAGWLPHLDFLVPVAVFAILAGAILGVIPVTVVVTLPLSALVGGLIVIWTVGGEYFPVLGQSGRIFALRDETALWVLAVTGSGYPTELSPYALGLGALMWVTAFMAGYAVYRHNRVADAVLLLGAALITNMSATYIDLFPSLLLFVAAALLLWLRSSVVSRQELWQRRRVNEDAEVSASLVRSGILFGAATVVLALVLTSVAVAAPLTNAWRGFDDVWTGVRDQFEGVFGSLTNPNSRITGNSFGSSFTVTGSWVSNDEETLIVAASRPLYMRTGSYDVYTGRGWTRSDGTDRRVGAGERLFNVETPERPTVAAAVRVETITVEMAQTIGRNLFVAGSPLTIFAPVVVNEPRGYPVIGALSSASAFAPGEAYQVSVAISEATKAELANAGDDYPDSVRTLYLDQSGISDRVREFAAQITEGAENDYERAEMLADYLSSDSSFSYATTAPVAPMGTDLVDYFLFDEENGRIGYCQHYASAMVVMARALGLPARVAVGFAPGEETEEDTYVVREANAHAWAEIYFPAYGWQIFEATKTIDPGFTRRAGDPSTAGRPGQIDPFDIFELEGEEINSLPSFQPIPGAVDPVDREPAATPAAGDSRTGNAIVMFVLAAVVVVLGAFRMRTTRRKWRSMPAGDRVWQQLTLAAERAGVGPRPAETIYEYAGWLEEQLPRQREPIRQVADGKVWQAYSGRRLTRPASERLDAAITKLRLPLLWLAIRRGVRRLVRR